MTGYNGGALDGESRLRHGLLVIGSLLVLAGTSTFAVAQTQASPNPSSAPVPISPSTAENASAVPPLQSRPTSSVIKYEMRCSPPRTVEEAGACAGQASADAAERANLINTIGGLLLLTSLCASAAALIYSARATVAAERQAGHAEKATEVTLRAYLGIEKVEVVWGRDGRAAFDIWVKNSGQTPAKYFELCCVTGITGLGAKLQPTTVDGPFVRWLQIGRDQTRSARLHPSIKSEITSSEIVSSTQVLYVSGQLRYEDIFGKVWTEDFRAFKWSPSGVRQQMSFAALKDEAPGAELLES